MSQKKEQGPPPMGMPGRGGRGPGGHMMRPAEKPKDTKKVMRKLINYIAGNKYLFYTLIVVMVVMTLLNLAIPSIQGEAINAIKIGEKGLSLDRNRFVFITQYKF